ncbi:class I SAM-dependent methyltransferase [Hahella sp. CR1]|uniref:class I SAM-dependent methyltransferase n=1 Tax=Hahella sp. CR1 TaxID=2992807 RepID=UPI002441A7C6|nr:class I SAM-dependent methyltransferase [Hahella sp. CR1]MDG9667332.1 class I SAM-dependent methyltransferase [Hahella sp. CR1]
MKLKSKILIRNIPNLASSDYCFSNALLEELTNFCSIKEKDIAVLDFGCGNKPWASFFSNVSRYEGIDVYRGKNVDIVYDGGEIPVPDETYDLIFSSSVLEHVKDINITLKEIERILKEGGVFISVVPFTNHVHGAPFDFHRPTRHGWVELLGSAFGKKSSIRVEPVDSRFSCLMNIITSYFNNSLYKFLKKASRLAKRNPVERSIAINDGGASPESASPSVRAAYILAQLNPINFLFGLMSYIFGGKVNCKETEGEITSGYKLVVVKSYG